MYTVTAQVINAFSVPASEKYEESFKVQLMGDSHMNDGQVKKEMLTLSVPPDVFHKLQPAIGKQVTLPVSFFVRGNQLNPFYPKSAKLRGIGDER
jgi:hypothetical protein